MNFFVSFLNVLWLIDMDGRAGRFDFVTANAFAHGSNFMLLNMLCWYTNTTHFLISDAARKPREVALV